jgi:hypothetical protein
LKHHDDAFRNRGWSIGFADDAPGPFASRAFAEAIAESGSHLRRVERGAR